MHVRSNFCILKLTFNWFNVPMARGAVAFNGTSCVLGVMNEADAGRSSSLMSVLKHVYQV